MSEVNVMLELDDIQSGVLRPRPSPYAATYVLLRIDDRAAGRELMRRAARSWPRPRSRPARRRDTWVSVALTYQGLKALGVPQASLDSFAWEFRQGMARARTALGDTGESSPEHWERPLGTPDVHVVLAALAPDAPTLEAALGRARERATRPLPGVDGDLAPGLLRAAHRAGALRVPGRHQPSRRSRAAAFPGPIRTRAAAQGGRVRPRLPRRDGASRRCLGPMCWVATARTWCSGSCTSAWPRSADI